LRLELTTFYSDVYNSLFTGAIHYFLDVKHIISVNHGIRPYSCIYAEKIAAQHARPALIEILHKITTNIRRFLEILGNFRRL
jgi:hypothetical protein